MLYGSIVMDMFNLKKGKIIGFGLVFKRQIRPTFLNYNTEGSFTIELTIGTTSMFSFDKMFQDLQDLIMYQSLESKNVNGLSFSLYPFNVLDFRNESGIYGCREFIIVSINGKYYQNT